MTIAELKERDLIVFEVISGSHAYGLATASSDVDIKGVFVLPKKQYYGLEYVAQVNDENNDIVYYELGRFVDLLGKSNPNILEMLYTPEEHVMIVHPIFEKLRSENFLSKQCKDSFGGYAMTQVRKAKSLNKKILNPIEKERKGVLDFCYVPYGQGSLPVLEFLEVKNLHQNNCGLSRIPHMHEMYGLYYGLETFKGIVGKDSANEVMLSSIPKGIEPITVMSFNQSGYSKYCKEYKEYWEWVAKRNDSRYQNTLEHGKNYDAKNMMHTFRLLQMCLEIGREGKLNVSREDREYLLSIKNGDYEYEALVDLTDQKINQIEDAYKGSCLPESINKTFLQDLLVSIRSEFYDLGLATR